jgi:hypothetical protein
MKRLFIAALAASSLALSSCAGFGALMGAGGVTSPAAVAGHTTADEEAMRTAELLYKGWRTAVEVGVDAGLIKGERATRVADIDNRLFAALKAVRAAYRSFNATDFHSALQNLNDAAQEGQAAIKG